MRTIGAAVCSILVAFFAAGAAAQENPELGEVGEPPAAAGGQPQATGQFGAAGTGSATWGTAPASTPEFEEPDAASVEGESDHSKVAGHFGVGFFGVMDVPVFSCLGDLACPILPPGASATVSAPTVGLRYWLDEGMAIEAALGLGISSQSVETTMGMTTAVTPLESTTAFGLHGGLPLALAHSGHFVFQLVPELNFAIASGSLENPTDSQQNWDLSGLLFEIGGRVGGEIHFGFIDIPQLSLQGTVGLRLRVESRSAERATPATTHDQSTTSVGTNLGGEPWDIFTGSITAIYYFVD